MNRALLGGAGIAVLRAPVLVPAAVGLVTPLAAWTLLDGEYAVGILRVTAVLLGCALLASVDDPTGEVAAASPISRGVRVGSRVAVAAGLVLPVWALALAAATLRQSGLPLVFLSLQALTIGFLGVALALTLRTWRDVHSPAQPAALALIALVACSEALGRWYALGSAQPWGSPLQAAWLRFLALLLLGGAVIHAATRDPLGRRR